MHIHKLQINVPENHDREISIPLPDDFPSGPAEVIVLAAPHKASRPPALTTSALAELLSFQRTPEEEKVLDDFESFQRVYPFSLSSLAKGA
jgi:hypothetical protein